MPAVKVVLTDPWAEVGQWSWSHDSAWIAYTRSHEGNNNGTICIYNVKDGTSTQVTTEMFSSFSPAFDREGKFLYFASARDIDDPMYSDLDTTWIYTGSQQLFALPLNKDVSSPLLPKSDEETLKKEDKKDDAKKDEANKDDSKKDESKKDEAKKEDDSKDDPKQEASKEAATDPYSGTWSGTAKGGQIPGGSIPFTLKLRVKDDGTVAASITSPMGSADSSSASLDKSTGAFTASFSIESTAVTFTGTLKDGAGEGTWSGGEQKGTWSASRAAQGDSDKKDEKKAEDTKPEETKPVKIDFEGMESRAVLLPIARGNFNSLSVNSDNKLLYIRYPARGTGEMGIKIFDPTADEKEEKSVVAGAGGYELSADGKKLLVIKGGGMSIADASAGAKTTDVPTAGMRTSINPREEWKQIFLDTWRLQRDFFYEPTLHNVDWPRMRDHYLAMIDDCVSREDVAYVQAELISELNVGHAYITSPGEVEDQPSVSVGMLGCDFALAGNEQGMAYQITQIYSGAPWDVDARGPLSQPGVDVKTGEYLLAVNAVPVDTSKDPWAAFIDTADRVTTITVGPNPIIDDKSRDLTVKPISGESSLRYRAWVEANRQYVHKASNGQIGYIYVPNTGVDGQNELYRQFIGQRHMPALLIDERWNGGGQIPTRFIELLSRKPTNYWARRHGNDWSWPPDGHFGPKAMLINGLAGSGGDAFPNYFREMGLGKLFGTRTWGGLVGISGNPGLIDGGSISVPTFGYYRTNGNWGIEGHGVDPDVEVLDDPSKMLNGADPQIDAAVAHLLSELKTNPYNPPKRPQSPDRRGMGIPENQR
jgi:tricorn protease